MIDKSRRFFLTAAVAAGGSSVLWSRLVQARSNQQAPPTNGETRWFLESARNVHILTAWHTLLMGVVSEVILNDSSVKLSDKDELRDYCPSKLWIYSKLDVLDPDLRHEMLGFIDSNEFQLVVAQSDNAASVFVARLVKKLSNNGVDLRGDEIEQALRSIYHVERTLASGNIVLGRIRSDAYNGNGFCEMFGVRVACGWLGIV